MNTTPRFSVSPCRRRSTAGSVVLLVLVTILLAAFLLTKFVERAGTELLADARAGDQARLRREAYSALEVTLAVLAEVQAVDHGLHSPAQWGNPLENAGHTPGDGLTVEVIVDDESGKISLPRVEGATLTTLLESLGLEKTTAEQLVDALLVWTRTDHLPASLEADGSNYERARIPYLPARRPLRTFSELAAIETVRNHFFDETGRPTRLARDFAGNVSLYDYELINLNTATPAVLLASGLPAGLLAKLPDHIGSPPVGDRRDYFHSMDAAARVLGAAAPLQAFGTEARALRLTVTVRGGATVYRLSAVVAPPGGAVMAEAPAPADNEEPAVKSAAPVFNKLDYPFKVLEIREDVESPANLPADDAQNE